MNFGKEENKVWEILFNGQIENVRKYACSMYREGIEKLGLNEREIPTLKELNSQITPVKNWKVVRTDVRYMSTESWYEHLAQKEFIVTNFLRSLDEIEFTPEPDLFHDLFGHIPFLMVPEYMELIELFAPAYFASTTLEQKEAIKRLAWFSYEFGLIRENGELMMFGAGIMSSKGELEKVINGEIKISKFTIENVIKNPKAVFDYNKELFVFNSFDELVEMLEEYFGSFREYKKLRGIDLSLLINSVKDTEMEFT